ncbi:MAG: protein GrpE [Porticoccaceae bacterium]
MATEEHSAAEPESTAGAGGTMASAAAEPVALQERIAVLEQELAAAREQELRALAEVQNLRRRAERDVEAAHKFALEKFVAALLPVVDNLERALAAIDRSGEQGQALAEGVELTHKSLLDVLRQQRVEVVDPAGGSFDPALHEAVAMVPHPEVPANGVVEVLQRGYTLHQRLVRPAMVVVSQGAPAAGGQG